METILVAVVIGMCTLLASSMIYILVWNLFRVYFTRYMYRYFEYSKEAQESCFTAVDKTVDKMLETFGTIYKLENNLPVKEEEKKED